MEFSVGPVGADASWRTLPLNCRIYAAAKKEGQSPVEHSGVGPSESIDRGIIQIGRQRIGVAHHEIHRAARSIRSLVGCREILCRGRAIPERVVGAGRKSRGGRVQEINRIRAAINKARVRAGNAIENRGEISRRGIDHKNRRTPKPVIGLRANSKNQRAAYARLRSGDRQQFDNHAIIVRSKQDHWILYLRRKAFCRDDAARCGTCVIKPEVRCAAHRAAAAAVLRKVPHPQNAVSAEARQIILGRTLTGATGRYRGEAENANVFS